MNVDVPLIGNVGFDLPIHVVAHSIKKGAVKAVLAALDPAFPALMDAAATVGGGTAEAADQEPLTH